MKQPKQAGRTAFDVACDQTAAPWMHPADAMEQGRADAEADAGEAFRRLFQAMLPATEHCGGVRRFQAGYFRMCALSYRVGADEYWPGMTQEEVARTLGISYQAFKKHLVIVDRFLGREL